MEWVIGNSVDQIISTDCQWSVSGLRIRGHCGISVAAAIWRIDTVTAVGIESLQKAKKCIALCIEIRFERQGQ